MNRLAPRACASSPALRPVSLSTPAAPTAMSPITALTATGSLDVVALSHAHEDHSGGLAALIADFHPRELWTGVTPDGPAWRAVHDKAVAVGARIVPLRAPGT